MKVSSVPLEYPRSALRSGGAFALTGFAYQLLGSIDWATRVAVLDAHYTAQVLRSMTLTLEPANGGDAVHHESPMPSVVQFKTRGRGRWTDPAIVRNVLPDLFKATTSRFPSARFVLQSNAASHRSAAFLRLQVLLKDQTPTLGLRTAEAEGLVFRIPGRGGWRPASEFFNWAGAVASGETEQSFARASSKRARFARLVASLEIGAPLNEADMIARIDSRLRRVIPHPESVEQARLLMLGGLFDLAKRGAAKTSVVDIFKTCGVPLTALQSFAAFEARLGLHTQNALARLGYSTAADCRDGEPLRPGECPIALCGPSGVGKTWTLARAAVSARAAGAGVLWIEGQTGRESVRAEVANAIQAARGHTGPVNPHAARALIDAVFGNEPHYQLSVFLDRFGSVSDAIDILTVGLSRCIISPSGRPPGSCEA